MEGDPAKLVDITVFAAARDAGLVEMHDRRIGRGGRGQDNFRINSQIRYHFPRVYAILFTEPRGGRDSDAAEIFADEPTEVPVTYRSPVRREKQPATAPKVGRRFA